MTRRNTWYRAAAAVLSVALAAAVAACSSGGSQGNSGAAKVLTVWTWRPEDVPGLQAVAKTFTKETGMKVSFQTSTSDSSYATKIEAAARTGTLPDVLMTNLGTQGDGNWALAESGLLENLTPMFKGTWKSEISPYALQSQALTAAAIKAAGTGATSIHNLKPGQIWGVPIMSGSAGMIFANKSDLAKAGISTTQPPTTWEQFVSDVTKTQNALGPSGGIVTGLQVTQTGYEWMYLPLAWAYLGTQAFDARFGSHPSASESWTSPKSVQTFDLYNQLSKLWIPGALSLGITQGDQAFISRKAAWDLGGTFTLGGLIGGGVPESNIMVFPIPAATGSAIPKLSFSAGALVDAAVTKKAQDPAAALQFVKLLSSPAGAIAFAKGAGTIPATVLTKAQLAQLPTQISTMYNGLTSSLTAGYNFNAESLDDPATATAIVGPASVIAAKLVSGAADPAGVASQIQALYASAWQSLGQ